jgi:hypothetical protein
MSLTLASLRFLIGIGLVVIWGADARAKECVRSGTYHLTSSGPWPMHITARAGEACSAGFGAIGNLTFKRLFLVSPPQHGTMSLSEGGHYTYATKEGYRGPDSFMLRICGNEMGHDGCADLQYSVTID